MYQERSHFHCDLFEMDSLHFDTSELKIFFLHLHKGFLYQSEHSLHFLEYLIHYYNTLHKGHIILLVLLLYFPLKHHPVLLDMPSFHNLGIPILFPHHSNRQELFPFPSLSQMTSNYLIQLQMYFPLFVL